jgi:hypothetical protein
MIADANPGSTGYLALPSTLLTDLNSGNAPNLMWLTPNECDDGHIACGHLNNTVSQQNQYLSRVVPLILNSTTFRTSSSLLFVTWDEGTSSLCTNSPSQTYPICRDPVTAILAGPAARTGYRSNKGYSHYSFVTTLETVWNLTPLLPIPVNIPAPPMFEFLSVPSAQAAGGGSRMYRVKMGEYLGCLDAPTPMTRNPERSSVLCFFQHPTCYAGRFGRPFSQTIRN